MSQNATPATEFAPCHRFAQRWLCDSQKTRNMKLRDDANLSRLPHKMDEDELKNHEWEPFRTAVTRRLASYRAQEQKTTENTSESFPAWQGINELTTTRPRRGHDEATTRPRRDHDDTTTRPRRHDKHDANTGPTPRPPTINGNPSLRFREKYLIQIIESSHVLLHTWT